MNHRSGLVLVLFFLVAFGVGGGESAAGARPPPLVFLGGDKTVAIVNVNFMVSPKEWK